MEITVKRKYKKNDYTIGQLFINGKYVCDTLEDRDRGLSDDMLLRQIIQIKVKGKTAIPTGRYQVTMTYSQRFRRRLPLLTAVKGYSGIRIHAGNTHKDTEGCILCGENKRKGMVLNSRYWTYEVIVPQIEKAVGSDEVWITIK